MERVEQQVFEELEEYLANENEEEIHEVPELHKGEPVLHFKHKNGKLFVGDAAKFLGSLETGSVDLIFADPPYNIKKAEWDTFESQQAYVEWSLEWIKEASRVLKDDGSLYVCGFSEILADIKYVVSKEKLFTGCKWLVWHYKNKANLGKDFGRSHESILHFRKSKKVKINQDYIRIPYGEHTLKYPARPQAETSLFHNEKNAKRDDWQPHPLGAKPKDVIEIPTTCNGMGEKTKHPTQKPEELVRKFVLASSDRGDLVVDPFSGSGTTLTVAEQLGRKWMGIDISREYNEWAINRIRNAIKMTDEEWFWHDRKNEERRKRIR